MEIESLRMLAGNGYRPRKFVADQRSSRDLKLNSSCTVLIFFHCIVLAANTRPFMLNLNSFMLSGITVFDFR